ncbi:rhomboid family intramembrane serine protease [Flavobacterium sp.]|uniref:rhomboid family intramembrane serine protease n=1 Tax=Flavobacterium sp. TaxID=239 RepID=UPI0025E0231B|nr:rhomboid family intramembrane serine protease [Flavobacterium sp.]
MGDQFLWGLIIANVLISFKGFNDSLFYRKYLFHVGSIRAGEQVRMISSGFLHADEIHLAFNMITLYSFAPIVSSFLGGWSFLLIYFGSLIFGNLLTMVIHGNNYSYSAVGASGAVTGIIYSAILLYPQMQIYGFIPGYVFGVLYLLYSIYGMRAKNDNIGHTAHFGGAIGGYAITLLKEPILLSENTLLVIVLAVPIVILFVMAKLGKL